MSQAGREIEQRWALGDQRFEDDLEAGADILEAFAAAGLIDPSEAQVWRDRFARSIRGPLRWPAPRPEARQRALRFLKTVAPDGEDQPPSGILHHFAGMNLITAQDAAELSDQYWPSDQPVDDSGRTVLAVGVEQPQPESRIDVVWIVRSTSHLTIRWRLRDVQIELGNADVEPPDHLGKFALVTGDGAHFRPDGGGWSGGGREAEGTLEFVTLAPPGSAKLRFGFEERAVVIP